MNSSNPSVIAFKRTDTYTIGQADTKHKVIFSRANTSDVLITPRSSFYDRPGNRYSTGNYDSDYDMPDSDIALLSNENSIDGDETRSSMIAFPCGGDDSRWNFWCFCVGVSLSTAPVVSTLFWAPVMLNHKYAGLGNGCFFLVFAFTSISVAKPIVNVVGCTKMFLICLMGNLLYCICFMLEFTVLLSIFSIDMSSNGLLYPISAGVGGFSQCLMWTAHSKYSNKSAQLMVKSMRLLDIENANRSLASTFAFVYFTSLSMIFSIAVVTLALQLNPDRLLGAFVSFYLVLTTIALYCLCRLDHLGDMGDSWDTFQFRSGVNELIAGIKMLNNDLVMKLIFLIPYHVAWGCASSFWVFYMLGEVVKNEQGKMYVGVASIVDFTTSLLFSYAGNELTKRMSSNQTPMVLWGWACMTLVGILVIVLSTDDLGTRRRIFVYAIVHGMARAVYENNLKAVISNFFPEHQSIAQTVTSFSKSLTSGVSFVYYSFLVTRYYFGGTVIITSAMGVIGYLVAGHIHRREIAEGYVPMRTPSIASQTSSTSDSLLFVADYF